jgi:hypothetical protein
MPKGVYKLPEIKNEPVLGYAPGSIERETLKKSGEYRHHSMIRSSPIVSFLIKQKERGYL